MIDSTAPLLISAVMVGLLGGVHCLAMCGGIAGALGQAIPQGSPLSNVLRTSLYSIGRITSYAIAGGIVGAFGEAFSRQTGLSIALRVFAGLMILGFGLYAALEWTGLSRLEPLGRAVWRRLSPLTRKVGPPDRGWKILLLGMIWGWLPCGLVYSALIAAAATGRAELGAAFMLSFGIGTLPALISASALANRLSGFVADRFTRRAAGTILLCFGLWTIGGALMPLMKHHDGGGAHSTHSAMGMKGLQGGATLRADHGDPSAR